MEKLDLTAAGRAAMESEAAAILAAATRLDGRFAEAVELIVPHPGKVLVTGLGKSGRVGAKIAATLCSTGTPAVFLHPAEAGHGDLGVCGPGDPAVLISKSGSTAELIHLIPLLREFDCPLIGILGNPSSPIAAQVDVVLDASVQSEADPHGIAPTSSAAVAMALGDALAIAVMRARGFSADDFARRHPSGQLGRNLRLSVEEAMHSGTGVAWVKPEDPMRQVIIAMTAHPLGAACVLGQDGELAGLITDGDLRRALQKYEDIRPLAARDIMNKAPVNVSPRATLQEALRLMEDRPSQISVLPVIDPETGICSGLIRLHDLYRP